MIHMVHHEVQTLEEVDSVERSGVSTSSTDIPSWRNGDKSTYETRFDVAQLLAQATDSAS